MTPAPGGGADKVWVNTASNVYLQQRATELAVSLAHDLRVEGVLVVEMFVTESVDLLVNELAPRPHNTFHAVGDCCATSQFEQHVRAICGLPLGSTATDLLSLDTDRRTEERRRRSRHSRA